MTITNKFRIAILGSRGIPASYGGFETFAEELSSRLVEKGHEVTVFCEKKSRVTQDSYRGVQLRHVTSPKLGNFSPIIYDLKCLLSSLRNYDVIYMLGYGAALFFWIPRIFQKPLWVNMDGIKWKRAKWPWYGKMYLKFNELLSVKLSSLLIADSEEIENYLRKKYGSRIKCAMIPYGTDVVDTPPDETVLIDFGLKPREYYLVVCRLEPENQVREIIDGFVLSDTSKSLVIVGDTTRGTNYIHSLIAKSSERIRFLGSIYDKKALKAIRYHSFAYFHGHTVGGTNPSLLEALGCGNRVVTHDNPFNREVASNCAEYFVSPSDIPRIIGSLEKKGSSISVEAIERVREHYNWNLIVDKYLTLLEETLKGTTI